MIDQLKQLIANIGDLQFIVVILSLLAVILIFGYRIIRQIKQIMALNRVKNMLASKLKEQNKDA